MTGTLAHDLDDPAAARRPPRVDRPGRPRAGLPALRHGPDGPPPGRPVDQRGPPAEQHPAALDHRHLRLHGRRLPRHDGHARRPHRPPQAAAHRRRRVRRRVDRRGLLDQRRDAHRAAGPPSASPARPSRHRPCRSSSACSRTRASGSRAVAVWISAFSAGSAIGPIVGGILLEHFWWGSVFLIALPVMALLLILGPLVLPEYKDPDAGRLDLAQLGPVAGRHPRRDLRPQAGRPGRDRAAAARDAPSSASSPGIVFVRRQFRLPDPMLDLRLFRIPTFSSALTVNFLTVFVMTGYFLFIAQYLQLDPGPVAARGRPVVGAVGDRLRHRLERGAAAAALHPPVAT